MLKWSETFAKHSSGNQLEGGKKTAFQKKAVNRGLHIAVLLISRLHILLHWSRE